MSAFKPQYRLEVRAPLSVDPTETAVLTPSAPYSGAGAVHSDNFRITTMESLAGWQPYMGTMRGRRGRIDLKERKIDAGNLAVDLIDHQVTGNLNRWWTAFFGDAKGNPRGKLKVIIDESLDNGVTWNRFWTGRLQKTQNRGKTVITLNLRDEIESLKMKTFTGAPHSSITYAGIPTMLPIGVQNSGFGLIGVSQVLTGSTGNVSTIAASAQLTASMRKITFDKTSQNRKDNIATKSLYESVAPNFTTNKDGPVPMSVPNFTGTCRARIKHLSGANVGLIGVYKVGQLDGIGFSFNAPGIGQVGKKAIGSFAIATLDAGTPGFLALPAVGVNVEVTLFGDQPISDKAPLFINDVDPATFLTDLCAGKFGYFYTAVDLLPGGKAIGDPRKTVALNSLAALVGTRPVQRYIIKERTTLIDYVETNILKQNNWAWYLDKNGAITVVDLNLPATLAGLVTITDSDVVLGDYNWNHDTDDVITRVEFDRYQDVGLAADSLVPQNAFLPDIPLAGIEEHDFPLYVINIGSLDFGDGIEQIDANGFRSMDGEQLGNQPRFQYNEGKLVQLAQALRRPYGWGLVTIALPCGRTSNVASLTPGALCLLQVSFVPDPTSNRRGGIRLVRVVEMSEDAANVNVTFCDMGLNTFASVPTLGAPSADATNPYGGVQIAVTLNAAGQPAEVAYAVVPLAGAQPADNDPLWTTVHDGSSWLTGLLGIIITSQTVTIGNLAPNRRVWIRARTITIDRNEPQLPSAWVVATSINTSALPAPSAPAATLVGGKSARITWTVGDGGLFTDVMLSTPVGDPPTVVGQALPTGNYWDLSDLDPLTTYRVTLRHRYGPFVSAIVTVDFTTGSTSTTAPNIISIQVVR
jgi:hypothetical protein